MQMFYYFSKINSLLIHYLIQILSISLLYIDPNHQIKIISHLIHLCHFIHNLYRNLSLSQLEFKSITLSLSIHIYFH